MTGRGELGCKGERDVRRRNDTNKNKGTINQRNSVSFWSCLCRIFPDALKKMSLSIKVHLDAINSAVAPSSTIGSVLDIL